MLNDDTVAAFPILQTVRRESTLLHSMSTAMPIFGDVLCLLSLSLFINSLRLYLVLVALEDRVI